MRRKDREITEISKIQEVMEACTCLHLGLNDQGRVYVVPLNFGYELVDDQFTLFFHGATEGRKTEVIRNNPCVGFEMETGYQLQPNAAACNYSAAFQSVIGEGTVEILTDPEEKRHALNKIMYHNTGREQWDFPEIMIKKTNVFRLAVERLTCKIHE